MSGIFGFLQNKILNLSDFGNALSIMATTNHASEIIFFSTNSVIIIPYYTENNNYSIIEIFKNAKNRGLYGFIMLNKTINKAYNIQCLLKNSTDEIISLSIIRNYQENRDIFTKNESNLLHHKEYHYANDINNSTDGEIIQDKTSKNIDTSIYLNFADKTITLNRNRFGKGGIYYYSDKELLLFCDKIKPLQQLKKTQCPVNYMHWSRIIINEQLATGITNETIYKNIYQVMPGEVINVKDFTLKKDIQQPIPIYNNNNSINENAAMLKAQFLNSFKQCISNSLPFGISLSGGLDSACIVAAANILHHQNISTYSVSFDDNPSNDTPYIKVINDYYSCQSHIIKKADFDFYQITDYILSITEHPFYDSGAIGHYMVLQKAAETGITTLLDGEGAEIAAGPDDIVDFFPYYNSLFFSLKWINVLKNYHFYKSYGLKIWAKILLKNKLGLFINNGEQWINPDFYRKYFFKDGHLAIFYKNYNKYAVDAIKIDYIPNSMVCKCKLADTLGINYQFPFLNEALLSFAMGIPERQKVLPPYTKFVLRKAFEKELPKAIFQRKDKMVYSGPSLAPFLNYDGKYYKTTLEIIKNSQLCKQNILLWKKLHADLYPRISIRLLNLCRMFDLFTTYGGNSQNW